MIDDYDELEKKAAEKLKKKKPKMKVSGKSLFLLKKVSDKDRNDKTTKILDN